jgi:hypothetical protein
MLFHFDHSPRAIVASIDDLRRRGADAQERLTGSWKKLALFILGGAVVIYLDVKFGYASHIFAIVGAVLVIMGFTMWVKRDRAAKQPELDSPSLRMTQRVIHTLRDDLAPTRNLHGSLDLRGSVDPGKLAHTKQDSRGRTVSYYRDDWLSMKAKLWDGSMLRVAVIKKLKIRDGYYKRGRVSGKQKFKPAVLKSVVNNIDVRISANPQLYSLSQASAPTIGQTIGTVTVQSVTVDGGLLRVVGSLSQEPMAQEFLELLRATYATLQRKDVA